jgi:hypothetical protein
MAKNKELSVGKLRPAEKTKHRSPDLKGDITLQSELIEWLAQEHARTGGEVVAPLAGWLNDYGFGKFISVEISIPFGWVKRQPKPPRMVSTLDRFLKGDDSEEV